MGVPKFYRWLSERYPCLSEVVKEHQIPEFDNLYLDMNGIIHICSHPNDDDVHFRITEEKIFQDIFHYIEVLFRMIQPRKVFFMAIDGVAPRAKMNQQRGRRFRSAKDAELGEQRARDRGEDLPDVPRFDSNCITPGTSFMDRLQQQLKYFVSSKISTDTLWQDCKVILSGHETPGEGEHKIMDYIRYERSKTNYDSNTRHCLYGLDADLVMLGMCTHDPHFSLLREEVRFGGKKNAQKRTTTPEETTFHLLHLSLLREYLDHEFSFLRQTLPFEYNLESIIDDWILLGFLVGNDFLPHLPHLHINKGALTELYDVYKRELPTLGGYINESGTLNLPRFEKFLSSLSVREMDRFDDIYSDNKWLEGKTAKKKRTKNATAKGGASGFETIITDTPGPASVEQLLSNSDPNEVDVDLLTSGAWQKVQTSSSKKRDQQELLRLLQSADDFLNDVATSDTDEEDAFDTDDVCCDGGRDNQYHMEFRQHKREYYIHKLGYDQVTQSVLKEQAEGYVRAIQWNLHYYYNGCKSWSWFYPHHFAPWITDIKNFSNMEMKFEMSKPFQPFEQLLSVLPPASKELLPKALQGLMVNETSSIIDFYPKDFESDLNGKQQTWEAVVLIPFIDEKRLLEAMEPYVKKLTPDEIRRNTHGPMQVFSYSPESLGSYPAPQYFPTIELNHARIQEVWREEFEVAQDKLRKGLLPETRLDVFYPGFPTLKHIPHKAALKQEGVRVFEQPSRGFNMILTLEDQGSVNVDDVAKDMLGQEIWVSWPHMVEAKVVKVRDVKKTLMVSNDDKQEIVTRTTEKNEFFVEARGIAERYKSRWGVVVGNTQIILQACVMTGRKYVCSQHGKITLEKQWSKTPQPFALQTTKKDILVHDPSFTQYRTLPELFPVDSVCFMLGNPNYGSQGRVVEISDAQKGRITLAITESKDVDLTSLTNTRNRQGIQYFPGFRAAQQLGISSHLLSRITGCVFILRGPKEADIEHASKVNIGLNLKHNKKNEEVCGFSKRGEDNNWMYSTKTIAAMNDYMENFPEIFDYLSKSGNLSNDIYHHSDVFPEGNGETRLKEFDEWTKNQAFFNAARQPCGTLAVDENVVAEIVKLVEEHKVRETRQTVQKMHVKPHLLFKANLSKGGSMPDPDTNFQLFDRVVNVRQGFSVPLGLKGTVTGLLQGSKPEDIIVEVLFDSEFSGGLSIRCNSSRSYRLPGSALINITFGRERANRPYQANPKPVARIKPNQNVSRSAEAAAFRIQARPNKQQFEAPKSVKKSEDGFCPLVAPPDPKSLPNPTGFFKTGKSREAPKPRAQQTDQPNSNSMEALWSKLQLPPPGATFNPPQGGLANPGPVDLSDQLKAMLNIGGNFAGHVMPHVPPNHGHVITQPQPRFHAPVSLPGHYPYPMPTQPQPLIPVLAAPGSYPHPMPGSYPRLSHPPPVPILRPQSSATAFIPLQVHKKQTYSKGKGNSYSTDSAQPATSVPPPTIAPRGSGRRDTVAPEQNDKPVAWTNQGEARGAPTGQSRGKKKRLAANFSTD